MAGGLLGTRRNPLRDLFSGGTAGGLSDGELLRRYAASRDGPAFEALVARHGPMVAATCRAILRDHHDVEDAFHEPPFRFDIVPTTKDLFPRDPSLISYPLVYIHGRDLPAFPREDLEALRRHLEPGGGTILADAACGSPAFDAAFRRFVAELLPDHRLVPIPWNGELFTDRAGFDLGRCQYTRAAGGGRGFPQLEGIEIDGHWAIIYSKLDLGQALEWRSDDDCKGYTHESAVRIVGNILIYSTFP